MQEQSNLVTGAHPETVQLGEHALVQTFYIVVRARLHIRSLTHTYKQTVLRTILHSSASADVCLHTVLRTILHSSASADVCPHPLAQTTQSDIRP